MFIDACAYVPMFILLSVLHGRAEVTRPEVYLIMDATLSAAVVDDF
jgi:hypothetical protein